MINEQRTEVRHRRILYNPSTLLFSLQQVKAYSLEKIISILKGQGKIANECPSSLYTDLFCEQNTGSSGYLVDSTESEFDPMDI
jgi:hypothetical protein